MRRFLLRHYKAWAKRLSPYSLTGWLNPFFHLFIGGEARPVFYDWAQRFRDYSGCP